MRTSLDIAWLGGLLEGEGSFINGISPEIAMQMTDRDTVVKAAVLLGVPIGKAPRKPKGKESYKLVWHVRVHGARAIGWMMTLYQFLGERRRAKVREILATWRASSRFPRAPRGQRWMATCHPDRVRSGRMLCHPCYMRWWRGRLA
jgi:hypothetical protein